MTLELGLLSLVLFSAVLHATWNAVIKASEDRLVITTLVMMVPGFPALVALFFLPAIAPEAWPFVVASALIHYTYYAGLIAAYRHGDLSLVYPIARGAAPALVAVGAWILVDEALSAAELIGVLIVSAGIMSLASRRRAGAHDGEVKAIGFALLTALSVALFLLADGTGVRRSGFALSYICWLFVLEGFPLLAFTLWARRGRIKASFGPHLKHGAFGGVINGVSYGIAIWAMGVGPMAHIVAVRETSVLIGAMIGTLVLKEPFGRTRIAAAAAVACGAVLLNVGG